MQLRYSLLILIVGLTARAASGLVQMPCPQETLLDHFYQDCALPPIGYGDTCPVFKTEWKQISFIYSGNQYVTEQGSGQNGRGRTCGSLLWLVRPCWPTWGTAQYDGANWSQRVTDRTIDCNAWLNCTPLPIQSCEECLDGESRVYAKAGQCCP